MKLLWAPVNAAFKRNSRRLLFLTVTSVSLSTRETSHPFYDPLRYRDFIDETGNACQIQSDQKIPDQKTS